MRANTQPVYHDDWKKEFLEETSNSTTTIGARMTLFRKIAPYEFEKDADISSFSAEEISKILGEVCGIRSNSRLSQKNILVGYIRWCVAKGKPGAVDHTAGITVDGEERFRDAMIRSPEHLQQCLNMVFDPEEDETTDIVYRCFFWMAYGGMSEENIHRLTSKDVHLEYMEAVKDDEIAVLYRQSLRSVRICVNAKQFLYHNSNYVNSGSIWRDRIPGDSILRSVRGKPNVVNFRSQISRKVNNARKSNPNVKELSYKKVWLSGVFYRLYELELAGVKPDFMALAIKSPNGQRTIENGSMQEKRRTLDTISQTFRADYKNWKASLSQV